jgi:hypothetical protein
MWQVKDSRLGGVGMAIRVRGRQVGGCRGQDAVFGIANHAVPKFPSQYGTAKVTSLGRENILNCLVHMAFAHGRDGCLSSDPLRRTGGSNCSSHAGQHGEGQSILPPGTLRMHLGSDLQSQTRKRQPERTGCVSELRLRLASKLEQPLLYQICSNQRRGCPGQQHCDGEPWWTGGHASLLGVVLPGSFGRLGVCRPPTIFLSVL